MSLWFEEVRVGEVKLVRMEIGPGRGGWPGLANLWRICCAARARRPRPGQMLPAYLILRFWLNLVISNSSRSFSKVSNLSRLLFT